MCVPRLCSIARSTCVALLWVEPVVAHVDRVMIGFTRGLVLNQHRVTVTVPLTLQVCEFHHECLVKVYLVLSDLWQDRITTSFLLVVEKVVVLERT